MTIKKIKPKLHIRKSLRLINSHNLGTNANYHIHINLSC